MKRIIMINCVDYQQRTALAEQLMTMLPQPVTYDGFWGCNTTADMYGQKVDQLAFGNMTHAISCFIEAGTFDTIVISWAQPESVFISIAEAIKPDAFGLFYFDINDWPLHGASTFPSVSYRHLFDVFDGQLVKSFRCGLASVSPAAAADRVVRLLNS